MRHGAVEVVSFEEAREAIARLLTARGGAHPHRVVGVTGAVGSGKSTLARAVSGCVVSTDDYLPDYETIPVRERDLPEHSHLGELRGHLEMLRSGRAADIPLWSFDVHRRAGSRVVRPSGVIVCEGLFALHETVLDVVDVRVFVEAPREQRLGRFEARELAGERGWSVEHAREHFREVADPTFERFAPAYRAAADLVVLNPDRGPAGG